MIRNNDPCPVHCLLSAWAATGNCSAECGGGQQTWVRNITREPEHGGRECSTNTTMVRGCNTATTTPARSLQVCCDI